MIGVNGTGKTTFLKILAQVEDADSGAITKKSSIRIEYLPQNPNCDEKLTVLEQVFFGLSADVKDSEDFEAKTILTKLGITELISPSRLYPADKKNASRSQAR